MSAVTEEQPDVHTPSRSPLAFRPLLRRTLGHIGPSTLAIVSWLVGLPAAAFAVDVADLDPMTLRGSIVPIVAGSAGAVLLVAAAARWATGRFAGRFAGIVAGLYASWIGMVLLNALHGTPFGHFALFSSDAQLLAALANRLSTTMSSADAFVAGLPAEYPPLYPWLIGRTSVLLDQPTWTLIGDFEVLFLSGSVVAAFLLWKRLFGPGVALAIAAIAPVVFTDPHKSYEIVTLAVFAPWLLAAFSGLPRRCGGMHWLPAGLIGGLFVLTYVGYLLYGALGVLAILALRLWRPLPDGPPRKSYLLHALGVMVTAGVVASWYLVPLLSAYLTKPRDVVADTYPNADIATEPLSAPFLDPTPIGVLTLLGVLGLFWYLRREWWAAPLLALVAGVYLYWLWYALRTVSTGHTGFLVKTPRMIIMLLATAGILTLVRAIPPALRRFGLVPPRAAGGAVLAVLLISTAITAWEAWTPGDPRGFKDVLPSVRAGAVVKNTATVAHLEPLPSGAGTRFHPGLAQRRQTLPVTRIQREVEQRLGADAKPVTLSYDMRLFAYLPWYAYQQDGEYSANSLMRFTERQQELGKLTGYVDPAEFTDASAHTKFGRIDVFVLRVRPVADRGIRWRFQNYYFDPRSFRQGFDIVHVSPAFVLAVRR